jgi:hypothetical protein
MRTTCISAKSIGQELNYRLDTRNSVFEVGLANIKVSIAAFQAIPFPRLQESRVTLIRIMRRPHSCQIVNPKPRLQAANTELADENGVTRMEK